MRQSLSVAVVFFDAKEAQRNALGGPGRASDVGTKLTGCSRRNASSTRRIVRESDPAGNSTIARSQGFSGTETESTAVPTVKSASPNTREVPHEPATTSMLVSATTHWTSQSRSHAHQCTVGSNPSVLRLRDSGIRTRSTQQTGDATTDAAKHMNITNLMPEAGAQKRARHCFQHPFETMVTSSIWL